MSEVVASPVVDESAAAAPVEEVLPAGWTAHLDDASGATYYWNATKGSTSWTKPEPEVTTKRARENEGAQSDYFRTLLGTSSMKPASSSSQWEKHSDPKTGVPFFFHTATHKTQWEVPEEGFVDATIEKAVLSNALVVDPTVQSGAEYGQMASFNKATGAFDQADGKSYWEVVNRPHDREGRMMSQYFDLNTLEANRAQAEVKKAKLKKYDWKKYGAAKKKQKIKRQVQALMID